MKIGTYLNDRLTFKCEDGTIYKFDNEKNARLLTGDCSIVDETGNFIDAVYILRGDIICNVGDSMAISRNHYKIEEMHRVLES